VKFEHVKLDIPPLERETIDGVRYYKVPDGDQLIKLVSITSITSFYNKEIFENWRKRVGNAEADKITKAATSRGTDMHTLVENYISNNPLPEVQELSHKLFDIIKPAVDRIGKIYGIEIGLYSKYLGIAGTADTIAEFDGELSIIDYKTSKKPKPRDWIENYFVQAAAYACMLHEITGLVPKKLVILMACENGKLAIYEEKDIAKYIKLLVKYIKNFTNEKLKEYEN
jgi:genome maintenance exonuclease 1